MSTEVVIATLTYIIILVMAYISYIFLKESDERSGKIINKAYKNAYSILLFGIVIVLTLIGLPHITLDSQTTIYLILASKFISVITLGGSIFILSKRNINSTKNGNL